MNEERIMAKLEKSIRINAPVERVFNYINGPSNLPEIWPSMVEAKDIQKLPNGGNRFRWTYKMAGMRFEGISEDTDVVPNQKVVSKTEGGLESTVTWEIQTEGESTNVSFQAEYIVPIPLLGKLAEAFIVRQNEHEAEVLLANLKARMEMGS
jgi:uncharacterized protein YndB with AHSA1/START domain